MFPVFYENQHPVLGRVLIAKKGIKKSSIIKLLYALFNLKKPNCSKILKSDQ